MGQAEWASGKEKRKVGEGKMKLGLLLRWVKRERRDGEKRVWGLVFLLNLFQTSFLFKILLQTLKTSKLLSN
jgi:hypothetical protein